MMTPQEAARHVNETWEYRKDGWLDQWSFSTPGDCENYSLLILKAIYGSKDAAKAALRKGDAHIWYAKTDRGDGHAVLEYQGAYIDNRTRHWVDDPDDLRPCSLKWRYPWVVMMIRMAIG